MSILSKIKGNKFSFNVLLLMAGTILGQAIPVLASPILTRLFTPDDFGLFALYFSITMVMSVFITGRYEMAVILPESDRDAANVMSLSFAITIVITILTFILFLIFSEPISTLFGNPNIKKVLLYVPLGIFFIGILQTLNYWFNRKELFKQLSISRINRSVGTVSFSFLFGFMKMNKAGLILGDIIGQGLNSIFLFFRALKKDPLMFAEVSVAGIKQNAVRYKNFPMLNVPSGLMEKLSGQLPVFVLTAFFSSTVAGLFALSQRVVSAPSALISRSVGDVFRQRASIEYLKEGNCKKLFVKTFYILLLVGVVPFAVFYFTAPWIFEVVFGKEWIEAGEYSKIMTLMFFLQFVISPLSSMFLVAEKQFLDFLLQVFLFGLLVSSMLIGNNILNEPRKLIILFTVCYSIKYCIELFLSYRFSLGKNKPHFILNEI